ncbi:MAG: VWA domain-containing protein [Pyrinomonadaceae bacterium]
MNRTAHFFFLLAILVGVLSISERTNAQTPAPGDDVVKITTKVVQLDAIVTDKDGRQVRDLAASDFVLLQDGKEQKITGLSYVDTGSAQPEPIRDGSSSGTTPTPPRTSRPGATPGRLITFVVDDGNCLVSQVGMIASREALQKFVNEQMLPGDRVAIYQTRSGSSTLQQYTSDRARLLQAASKIRWYPSSRGCGGPADGSFYERAAPNTFDKISVDGERANEVKTIESAEEKRIRESNEDSTRSNQIIGTLGVLRYIVRGLATVPGRKIVFFMSDGLQLRDRSGKMLSSRDTLGDLTDQANRSSVVFNTIDIRGLFDPSMIEARDRVLTRDDATASEPVVAVRTAAVRDSRDGLFFLANETGGSFHYNQNYLDTPIRQSLNLERGYYLIAYEPDDETFRGKKFNRIEISVKRPDLKVYSRSGFVGATTEPSKSRRRSENTELYEALIAPLPKAGLELRMTAFFGNTASDGNFVRSLTHLDGNAITFLTEGKAIKASFDVVAVTMNEKNDVVDEFTRTHTFKIDAEAMSLIKQHGIVYTTDVPIKKPGTYNFRLAIRDVNSRVIGSASQVIDIPDIKKNALLISGLTIDQVDPQGKFSIPSAAKPDQALSLVMTDSTPAVRRFKKGSVLGYAYTLYNARLDKNNKKPSLSIQVNLYRDGNLLTAFEPTAADLGNQSDWTRVNDFGYIRLSQAIGKGEYALQITVTDLLVMGASRTTSQWVDFEIE